MIIEYKDLQNIRRRHDNRKIVLCTGSFDLLHAGHVIFFESCKKFGDILIVGIGPDSMLKIKGQGRPILNEHIRIKMLDSLKIVDHCFIHKSISTPFLSSFMEEVLELLKPDSWVINTDATEINFRKEIAEKHKITLHILERTCPPEFENISTTGIIKKIKNNY